MIERGTDKICIISAPDASPEAITNLARVLEKEGNLGMPVYVTRVEMKPVSKEDVLDWIEALLIIGQEQGWAKEITERVKAW